MPDQRILYTEEMVGANHPSKSDTLNRLALVEHNTDGTHKDPLSKVHIKGADIASAATVNLDNATGDLIDLTGSATITAITLAEGRERTVRCTGAPIFTHGASLVLPGSVNIPAAAGDFAVFRGYAGGVVRCVDYSPFASSVIKPTFSVHKNGTNQTGITTSPTLITWPAELFDSHNLFASDKWTPGILGKYDLSAVVKTTSAADTGTGFISIYKNGSILHHGPTAHASTTGGIGMSVSATVSVDVATDYFEIYITQGFVNPVTISGAAIDTWFTGHKVG